MLDPAIGFATKECFTKNLHNDGVLGKSGTSIRVLWIIDINRVEFEVVGKPCNEMYALP